MTFNSFSMRYKPEPIVYIARVALVRKNYSTEDRVLLNSMIMPKYKIKMNNIIFSLLYMYMGLHISFPYFLTNMYLGR